MLVAEIDFDVAFDLTGDGFARSTDECLAGIEEELAIAADSFMVAGFMVAGESFAVEFVLEGEGLVDEGEGLVDECEVFVAAGEGFVAAGEGFVAAGEGFMAAGEGFMVAGEGFVAAGDSLVCSNGLLTAGDGFAVAVDFDGPDFCEGWLDTPCGGCGCFESAESLAGSGLLVRFSSFSDSFVSLAAATRSSTEISFESPDFSDSFCFFMSS